MHNIAVRFFVCSGVVLSALYLIWPATEVRAGRASDVSITLPGSLETPTVPVKAESTPLSKVSLERAPVPATSSIRN